VISLLVQAGDERVTLVAYHFTAQLAPINQKTRLAFFLTIRSALFNLT